MNHLTSSLVASVIALSATLVTGCGGGEMDGAPASGAAGSTGSTDAADLAPPGVGQGLHMQTEDVVVPPGAEQQDCYFFKVSELAAANGLPAGQSAFVHRVQIAQRDGSHHMNIFRVRTIKGLDPANGRIQKGTNGVGECFKSPNWADWPLVANTQQDGQLDWVYPEGVANELQADEWLMLQTHYVNATTQKTPTATGRVNVNLWTIPKEKVVHQMGTVFATKQSVRVCASNPTPSYSGTCQVKGNEPITIIGANGHFHGRGKKFEMFAWDGATTSQPGDDKRFYSSTRWDDPPMLRSPDLNVTLPANGGVFYTCNFQWQQPDPAVGCEGLNKYDSEKYMTPAENLDCCYTFGPIVEKNEHCNAFVYYYPKRDDVFCN